MVVLSMRWRLQALAWANAEAAVCALQAVAPVGVTHFCTERLHVP